jgi:hypothetical protein
MQGYDNLFNANHRNQMVEHYGFTQAQTVSVGTLAEYYEDIIKPQENVAPTR